MDLRFGEKIERLREAARAFADEHWPPRGDEAALPAREQAIRFRRRAIEAGFLARTVPREYGGAGVETDVVAETVIRQELTAAGVPWRANPQGPDMLVPTLLEEGSEEQRRRFVPKTLTGELTWCQGYSEPGAGSDLGSLQSRAELRGNEWVITGQKIWTSNADEADWMFGLFRTEPGEARSRGLSYLLVPMHTPGIEVRTFKQMTGSGEFGEVFFDEVRTPAENIVGRRGEGWKVSKATLKHERMLIGDFSYLQRCFDDVLALARRVRQGGRPAIQDPCVRQRLARIEGSVATQRFSSLRMLSAIEKDRDLTVVGEMLMAKLSLTNAAEEVAKLAVDLLSEAGLRAPSQEEANLIEGWDAPGRWVTQYMNTLGIAIAGGASNIQRNLIGERILGLPRDPRPTG